MTLSVSSAFDGGNIRLVAIDGDRVDLEIVKDHQSDFYQWFYFRLTGGGGRTLELRILNAPARPIRTAGRTTAPACRHDREEWARVDTNYADGVLTIALTPAADSVWIAYFAPYTMERHHELVASVAAVPGVHYRSLGQTLDGQELDYFTPARRAAAGLALRAPASRRDDGRMVDGGRARAAARRRRSGDPAAAREGDLPHRPEHEPGRVAARPPPHQRGRREPQPRMARAEPGEQPGGVPRPRRDGPDRRRFRHGRAWRRGDRRQFPRRLRGHPVAGREEQQALFDAFSAALVERLARFPDRQGL